MRLDLGAKVCCSDGDLGELADIVIDPTTRKVTHVVVDPEHEMYTPRLVPIALVRPGDGELLELDCTLEQVRDLEQAEEVAYLRLGEFPVDDPAWDVQVTGMLALPYYQSLDMPTGGVYAYDEGVDVLYQRVPKRSTAWTARASRSRSPRARSRPSARCGSTAGSRTDACPARARRSLRRGACRSPMTRAR
jgi:sporulation protein YlmC with PRC-barrel domain